MNLLLGEHGETLVYGIVGIFMVLIICTVCTGKWKELVPDYKTQINQSNKAFKESIKNQYPIITADEVIYATYKDEEFDYKDFITAKDCNGKDISNQIEFYGTVDVFKRGLYTLRCVVQSANELICSKDINVIVE